MNSLHMCSSNCKYCSYKLSRRVLSSRKTHCSCQKLPISNIIWPYGIIYYHTVTLLLFFRCTKRKLSQGNYIIAVIIRYASSNIMKGQEISLFNLNLHFIYFLTLKSELNLDIYCVILRVYARKNYICGKSFYVLL